jgi:quercetin dioxygenase-like cupin family protein
MLTRRGFAFCGLCAATGFLAADAEAQTAPAGLKRTIVSRVDGPVDGYETINARVEIEPGALVARHTHPRVESSYVVSGSAEITIDGIGARSFGAGEGWLVPRGVPHSGKVGDAPAVLAATYIVEKGKPLATPA